jgi:hypothetical protein
MKIILMAIIGALAAILANKGVAVFNDGLRPIMPEFLEGRMDRKALAATSFAMSFGSGYRFRYPYFSGGYDYLDSQRAVSY